MKNGNTSAAVMNQRAPRLVEADDAARALWRKLDWFATPPWATRAGAELIKSIDPEKISVVWEPACGDGIMARVLEEYFRPVARSDIHPQCNESAVDFLAGKGQQPCCDWIITNPPFALAKEFTLRALERATRGVAMLCRLNWLESVSRYELFHGAQPLQACCPFAERVPMQLGPWDPDCSSATAYAWFIWDKRWKRSTWLGQIIPPGTRERLTKPDDVRRFCKQTSAPLLD